MSSTPIYIKAGTTMRLNFTWSSKDTGIPIDLRGWLISFHVYKSKSSNSFTGKKTDPELVIDLPDVEILDAENGKCLVSIEPEMTVGLVNASLVWDCVGKEPNGDIHPLSPFIESNPFYVRF